MIKVFLVDDHTILRSGMDSLLQRNEGFTIAGHAATAGEALQQLARGVEVDLLLTDLNMPGMPGAELVKAVRNRYPDIKVVVLTMVDTERHLQEALARGAVGYLLKSCETSELLFALQFVARGGNYVCAELAFRLVKDRAHALPPVDAGEQIRLSEREAEILHMIANGMTNQEIGDKLFTSKRTVEGHRQNLLNKTGTNNTATLIRYAINHRLLQMAPGV